MEKFLDWVKKHGEFLWICQHTRIKEGQIGGFQASNWSFGLVEPTSKKLEILWQTTHQGLPKNASVDDEMFSSLQLSSNFKQPLSRKYN